eukprot:COSAG03_NODE_1601_length_3803_cov_7.579374_2_plen_154_part_00
MPADAPHHIRMAAAHQAAREAARPHNHTAAAAYAEPEPEPEPELADSEGETGDARAIALPDQLRVTVVSEASAVGGGRNGKGGKVTLTVLAKRSEGVAALLTLCKNKLRIKKKGGQLLVAATREALSDSALSVLREGTELRFVPPTHKGKASS